MAHVMYIFINTSLGMQKGKMCGQVGHAVQYIIEDIFSQETNSKIYKNYVIWKNNGCKKV